jgi:hypothetical protein
MVPKEKAHNLYIKYRDFWSLNEFDAKQCALIAVDEILDSFSGFDFSLKYIMNRDYWLEVKQEIEKL